MIYSFLTIMDLIHNISKLNKEERKLLVSGNCSLDQKRILKVKLQQDVNI